MEDNKKSESLYSELKKVEFSDKILKKNDYDYLPWAVVLDLFLQKVPDAEWKWFDEVWFPDQTVMVSCVVTARGLSRYMHLPVMTATRKAMVNPSAKNISDARMRCLVKAIGAHGLGIQLWTREDMEEDEKRPSDTDVKKNEVKRNVEIKVKEPLTTTGEQPSKQIEGSVAKILQNAAKIEVTQQELERALGCKVEAISEQMLPHIKSFFQRVKDNKDKKKILLGQLYDAIHDNV